MLGKILAQAEVPRDAGLILATAKGEIDLLERAVLKGSGEAGRSGLRVLLERVREMTGAGGPAMVLSAACVSSTAALARAASMVRAGESDCVAVVACDSVTEFVFSGFSSLMAMDRVPARPFDKDRAGLSVGEAAAFALVMSPRRARREGREVLGEIAGWGLSSDANHMTGPLRDGSGQATAIRKAMESARMGAEDIGSVSAHGTGTLYNDSMEMKAVRSVFGEGKRPVYSVKGGVGHSMGAAGLVEALLSLRSLGEGVAPPTVNLRAVDEEAEGWVSPGARPLVAGKAALSMNSGFGGVNAALILTAQTESR
jgi:3-oxoacyl-[acyl-carrier-protein] synthase II